MIDSRSPTNSLSSRTPWRMSVVIGPCYIALAAHRPRRSMNAWLPPSSSPDITHSPRWSHDLVACLDPGDNLHRVQTCYPRNHICVTHRAACLVLDPQSRLVVEKVHSVDGDEQRVRPVVNLNFKRGRHAKTQLPALVCGQAPD